MSQTIELNVNRKRTLNEKIELMRRYFEATNEIVNPGCIDEFRYSEVLEEIQKKYLKKS